MHEGRVPVALFYLHGELDPLLYILHAHDRHNGHHLFQPDQRMIFGSLKDG